MAYLKFKADKIFNGLHFLEAGQVLITDPSGTIQDLVPETEAGGDIQQFSGILSPGFINSHCHLELSHLKDVIPPHTGLIDFLCSVVTKRDFPADTIQEKIIKAEKEMYDNGIVAVGDIGNTADTLAVKQKSKIWWQNFTEVLSFTDEMAEQHVDHYKKVADSLEKGLQEAGLRHRTSLVPHAPYSISPKTFQLLNAATRDKVISIHNQEHPAEDELYKTGGGGYLRLFKIFGMNQSPFPVTGKSSIRSVLPYFDNGQTIILVHNTFMPEEDMVWANAYAAANGLKLVYCICINANLYIENKVPPIDLLLKHNCHIVLGTDSYSSNWQLSITKEIESMRKHFPHIPLETVLQWATDNGATALKINDRYGKFKASFRPGIILVQHDLAGSERLA